MSVVKMNKLITTSPFRNYLNGFLFSGFKSLNNNEKIEILFC